MTFIAFVRLNHGFSEFRYKEKKKWPNSIHARYDAQTAKPIGAWSD